MQGRGMKKHFEIPLPVNPLPIFPCGLLRERRKFNWRMKPMAGS
jgi:hypothetical protein